MTVVYSFGYRGRTLDELADEVVRLNAIVIDVRYRPFGRGRNQAWSRRTLQSRFSARYAWIEDLGNTIYRNGGQVVLAAPERGIERLRATVQEGLQPLLLCACESVADCHRTVVAAQLGTRFGWDVVHLVRSEQSLFPVLHGGSAT